MIDFTLIPQVAYAQMNDVHTEEAQHLNTIETLLHVDAPYEEISLAVEALIEHTREHFANEERLMREVNFPAFMMHKSEHDRALNELQHIFMDWRNKKDNSILKGYFLEVVPEWLNQHISSMDTVTAQFIAMRKGA